MWVSSLVVPSPLQPEQHSFGGPSARAAGKKGQTGISRGLSKQLPHMPEVSSDRMASAGPQVGDQAGRAAAPGANYPSL